MTAESPAIPAALAGLMAPGAPFELSRIDTGGGPVPIFRNGPHTLNDLYRIAIQYEARTAAVCNGRRAGYGELLRQALALAGRLRAELKNVEGARVAIAMHNRIEWLVAFIGITAAGATAVAVNSRGTAPEIAAALADTGCELLLADAARAQLAEAGGATLPKWVVCDAGETAAPQWRDFNAALEGWEALPLEFAALDPEAPALVLFTSGTTGGAKGALLSHRSVLLGLMNIQLSMALVGAQLAARYGAEVMAAAAARQPSALLSVPLFHTSGCYAIFLSNLMRGGKIVILPKWNAAAAVALIETEQIQAFSGSPTMLWDVLRAQREGRDLSSLMSLGVGGQALQPQLLREVAEAFPRAVIGVGYGMTEANGSVCQLVGPDLLARPTSSGRVLPTAQMKIVDEQGAERAQGEVGEIWLRGAMLMRGYCNRPEATAAVLHDGWLKTGDLGRLDDEGYLYVIDRKKDIVIAGGENISCTEVEGAALDFDGVAEVAALGVPDERLGERLVLAVVPLAGRAVDGEQLKAHIGGKLAIYKVPREVFVCGELPRNALGKVNRDALRKSLMGG